MVADVRAGLQKGWASAELRAQCRPSSSVDRCWLDEAVHIDMTLGAYMQR